MTTPDDKQNDWRQLLPFPARWLYFIALKLVVLGLVLFFALRWRGLI